jgi:hypothetical protein
VNDSSAQFITSCLRIIDHGGRKTRHCEDTLGVDCRQIPSTELRKDLLVNDNKYFEKFLKVFGEHLNISILITWRAIIRWLWLLSGKAKPHESKLVGGWAGDIPSSQNE